MMRRLIDFRRLEIDRPLEWQPTKDLHLRDPDELVEAETDGRIKVRRGI